MQKENEKSSLEERAGSEFRLMALGGEADPKLSEGHEKNQSLDDDVAEEEQSIDGLSSGEEADTVKARKERKKKKLKEAAEKASKRGVCYLSRIPPRMDHVKLRQILSQYGEIQRIYLVPQDASVHVRKRAARFENQSFSEGWVEFTKKNVAKRIANMLNGQQIGGKKKSSLYYDLWNIKYLSKFKWDDLTDEIAYKSAVREQKLALEISAAKRERDFYLSKVDKSRALSSIDERLKKKQKVREESGDKSELPVKEQPFKVIRQFPQKQPVADNAAENKPRLSRDLLAGVFR